MTESSLLKLSVGESIAESRLDSHAYSGQADIQGKSVNIAITSHAIAAIARRQHPILIELELYFSCLVRKQVRFRSLEEPDLIPGNYTRVLPGLFASFRAVCTKECKVADVGDHPPVETLPVKKPGLFVPDWVKIDFRADQWLGEYGFERTL